MTTATSRTLFAATLIAATLAAIAQPAAAQTAALPRVQVQADLIRAHAAGDNGDWKEDAPFSRTSDLGTPRTRAEVLAELAAAQASGELQRSQRDNYEPALTGTPKTRQQVRAETSEARRLGLLDTQGHDGLVIATPEQLARIEAAGQRALIVTTASASLSK
ncbi:hypothetical protein [Roseateles noduli]|uniref:hypothetical protein n=1 Tax=Roseateles noduli TaxID=2052484 RepID=UPI003D6573DC